MYVTFLRSINVGGRNIIKMKDLVEKMEHAGFSDVKTYIQSGNILFNSTETDVTKISVIIEKMIFDNFNLNIVVVVLKNEQLNSIINDIPYDIDNTKSVYITLVKNQLNDELSEVKNDFGDSYILKNNVFYIKCLQNYSDTKFNNSFFEKKYKITATTRNIDTLLKLKALAE